VVVPEPGTTFDPSRHRAAGTVPVDDPERNGTIAEASLDGYLDVETGRVVTAAEVRVNRWIPAEAPPEPESENQPEPANTPS
jgi:molecular chaperone GrpE